MPKLTSTMLPRFYDGLGNIAERELYSDGVQVARLLRPGVSRSTIVHVANPGGGALAASAAMRFEPPEPDLLYNRFEGTPAAVDKALDIQGFKAVS